MTPRTPSTEAGRAAMRGIIGGYLALWRDEPDAIADLILAIEAEAREGWVPEQTHELREDAAAMAFLEGQAEARATLDVERLARALHMLHVPGWFNGHRSSDLDLAAAIAREYAALREETTDG